MTPWTIVIPLAGAGTRLATDVPKPLVDIDGELMVEVALKSLAIPGHYVFVAQKEHDRSHQIGSRLKEIKPDSEVVFVDGVTDGPVSSVLAAKDFIGGNPLLIANVDQSLVWNPDKFIEATKGLDGMLVVHTSSDPKFSYAKVEDGLVTNTAEKNPISTHASSGVYWWNNGNDFLSSAGKMISYNDRVNQEFYVTPTYNYAIRAGLRIGVFEIEFMIDMGSK